MDDLVCEICDTPLTDETYITCEACEDTLCPDCFATTDCKETSTGHQS